MTKDQPSAKVLVKAEMLRKLMQERKLTIRELGHAINVSHQAIAHILNGHHAINEKMAVKLAGYFGLPPDQLVSQTREEYVAKMRGVIARLREAGATPEADALAKCIENEGTEAEAMRIAQEAIALAMGRGKWLH